MNSKIQKLVKVSDKVFYLSGEHETDRPNLYYIKGLDYSVAIDAGNSKSHVELFYKLLIDNNLPLPSITIITHWHWDHTFGLPFIVGTSVANELTRKKLLEVKKWKWNLHDMKERELSGLDIAFCNDCIVKEYSDLSEIKIETVTRGISKSETLDLGDITLTLYPIDSIHSRDALLVYSSELKSLFVGDADCEDFYDNEGNADPKRIVEYRNFIKSLDFNDYYVGHDKPDNRQGVFTYLQELLKKYQ